MKLPVPTRRTLIIVTTLLLSNILTGLITTGIVRSRDFSETNMNCLANWGGISVQLEDAKAHKITDFTNNGAAGIYRLHEDNARFLIHYPKFNRRLGMDKNLPLILFCWAVAADDYQRTGVDIPIDPQVWQAFLTDGPKSLPLYWEIRQDLIRVGADHGLLHDPNPLAPLNTPKPPPYKMPPLSRPYQPRPDEANPT